MKKPRPKTHLTPNDVARLLMVNPVTVRQWAARGLLRSLTTPGGHRRFLLRDVEEFARSRGTKSLNRPGSKPERILIVDSDPQVRTYIAELIHSHEPDVTTEQAVDGFDAGVKMEAFRPHVLVLDLAMPGLDGLSVFRRLRSKPTLDRVRIVAVNGHGSDDEVAHVLEAGADACLNKPIDPVRLLSELGLVRVTEVSEALPGRA